MPTAAEAWAALNEAMDNANPACSGAAEFTSENPTPDDLEWCAEVCKGCPLFDACKTYADTARPAIGFWAGRPRKGRTFGIRKDDDATP